jgi:coenzyme F420-reducing hydrogenase delta subunit
MKKTGKKTARITALLCENSAWKAWVDACGQGADAAKTLDGIDAVKLPCSGTVETGMVLKLLEAGAAGVLVLACPKDNCTFIRGSYRAEKRVASAKAALREAGLDDGRVRIDYISSLDSRKLLDIAAAFRASILEGVAS